MESKKDNFNIFLTWQNDVPKQTNKDYIEKCVSSVVESINNVAGKNIFAPPLMGGSSGGNFNPIETTVLNEIMAADVLIADLTSTERFDSEGNKKFQLNANVAYETGIFLGKKEGILNDSLIAVNNEAWVPTSNSPFDFRGRSQIVYKRNEELGGADLGRCTSALKKDIKNALHRFLITNEVDFIPKPQNNENKSVLTKILDALPFRAITAIIENGRDWILPDYAFNVNDNFIMTYQDLANEISDEKLRSLLNDFATALSHILDYGYSFFPDVKDGYICPETHRDSCDYQNAITALDEKKNMLLNELKKIYSEEDLREMDDKASKALINEVVEIREKLAKGIL